MVHNMKITLNNYMTLVSNIKLQKSCCRIIFYKMMNTYIN